LKASEVVAALDMAYIIFPYGNMSREIFAPRKTLGNTESSPNKNRVAGSDEDLASEVAAAG